MSDIIAELKSLCGSESKEKDSWIKFMDQVEKELPFLSGDGRPSVEDINNSIIGQEGFKSWKDFVVTRLKFSFWTYKAWKKAYILIKQYSYLRELGLSSSEINTLNQKSDEFPLTLEGFEALKSQKKEAFEQQKAASLAAVTAELAGVKEQNLFLIKENMELELELEKARKEVPATREMILPVEDKKSFLVSLVLSIIVNAGLIVALLVV